MTATYLTVLLFFLFLLIGVPVSVSLILGLILSGTLIMWTVLEMFGRTTDSDQ